MRAFLRIVRLPNVITAASNSLAGAFCAGIALNQWQVLAGLAWISMAIYASGILLNDLFDLEEDRLERPERPLPSGQVQVRTAAIVAIVLMAIGLSIAWALGVRFGMVASILVAAVLGYDLGLKRTCLGPWVMGLCRGANFALGLASVPAFDGRLLVSVAGYAVYVAGVTYISRQETYSGRTDGVRAGFTLIVVGGAAVLLTILLKSSFRYDSGRGDYGLWPTIVAIVLLVLLLKTLASRFFAVMSSPEPSTIGAMVKTGVISLPLLDFAQTLSLAGIPKAVLIAMLWIVARVAATRLYAT